MLSSRQLNYQVFTLSIHKNLIIHSQKGKNKMRHNRLTKIIIGIAMLTTIVSTPVSAMTTKTFTDTSKYGIEVKLEKDKNIYSDDLEKTQLTKTIVQIIPDYAKNCIEFMDIILYSGSINQIISKKNTDLAYTSVGTNAIFGNLKGSVYGEYRENKNEIAVDSALRDDIFTITFLHEIGHAVDRQYNISSQLTNEMIENICEMTRNYSPLNNPSHMDTPDEAAAELFMFCITQPDIVKDILPDNLQWMIKSNIND